MSPLHEHFHIHKANFKITAENKEGGKKLVTEETFSKEHRNGRKERIEVRQKGNWKAGKRRKRAEIKTEKKQQNRKRADNGGSCASGGRGVLGNLCAFLSLVL